MLNAFIKRLFAEKYGTANVLVRLFNECVRPHWLIHVVVIAMMAVVAACTASSAYLLGNVINQGYLYRDFSAIVFVCIATFVIFTIKGFAAYGYAVTSAWINNRIGAENQRRMFDKLLQEGVAYFADRHSSHFMASVTFGASAPSALLNLLMMTLGRDLLSLFGLVCVMVSQEPGLSLFGLIVAPPAIFGLRKFMKRVRDIAMSQFSGGARILETMQETVQGFRVIKAFNLEGEMRRRVYADVAQVEQASNKMARVSNRSSPLMESLGGFAIATIFLYGGYRVFNDGAQPGQFVAFITAFILAYEPAKRIARLHLDLNNTIVGVQVLYELLDSPSTEPEYSGLPALEVGPGQIKLDQVKFAYREGEPVLNGLSFLAEPGRVTALVGPSGGGKSTVFNLLLRFYDLDGGSITIDGQDIAGLSRSSVRGQLGYVGQDVFLFNGSIRDNILFGKPDATEVELIAAANAAFAHEFITGFPLGYDTPVGEHGMHLSGGQRQRVAVARALIKNAPIILLDEPTASLDNESERKVQDAIAHLCEGRTTLVIAHRLHTIVHADCIHVIDHGVVVESGRHEALLRLGGSYADVFNLYFRTQIGSAAGTNENPMADTAAV